MRKHYTEQLAYIFKNVKAIKAQKRLRNCSRLREEENKMQCDSSMDRFHKSKNTGQLAKPEWSPRTEW